jgi:hypothetical protein
MKDIPNLIRISDATDLPLKRSTFYKWYHMGKYPELFVKIGGALFLNKSQFARLVNKEPPIKTTETQVKKPKKVSPLEIYSILSQRVEEQNALLLAQNTLMSRLLRVLDELNWETLVKTIKDIQDGKA